MKNYDIHINTSMELTFIIMLAVLIIVLVAVISFICGRKMTMSNFYQLEKLETFKYLKHEQQFKDHQQNLKTAMKQEVETYIQMLKQEIADLKSQKQTPEALDKTHEESKPFPPEKKLFKD